MLGFLDFGMLSTVPESVRDALVCAVAHVVFSRDVEAVAELFAELQLLPREVVEDPVERAALASALDRVFNDVLQYPEAYTVTAGTTPIPVLRFDKLLGGLTTLVARFQFSLPPYFVNIARALATLEGVARKLDPSFNALRAVYPYALNRILQNPSTNPIVENTLFELMKDPETGRIDRDRIRKIIADTAVLSETTRARILFKVLRSRSGKHMAKRVAGEVMRHGSVGKKRHRTGHHIFEL
jgi:predicted unusual protein kinase regulating ubiquinone biosynthesis (AarF/ABC1/UbiB family)